MWSTAASLRFMNFAFCSGVCPGKPIDWGWSGTVRRVRRDPQAADKNSSYILYLTCYMFMDGLCGCICCTACVEKLQCMYVIVCMYAKTLHRMAWEVYICVFVGYSATFSIIHRGLCALPASRGISWSGCIIRSTMGCKKNVTPAAWSWKKRVAPQLHGYTQSKQYDPRCFLVPR